MLSLYTKHFYINIVNIAYIVHFSLKTTKKKESNSIRNKSLHC